MDHIKIKSLLEKYWEGETSLEEETDLKQYFNQSDIASEFKEFQSMFHFFEAESIKSLGDDFEDRLLEKLKEEPTKTFIRRNLYSKIVAAAAILLLTIGVFKYCNTIQSTIQHQEIAQSEIAEANEAFRQAKAALLLVSSKFKKGSDQANIGFVKIAKTDNKWRN